MLADRPYDLFMVEASQAAKASEQIAARAMDQKITGFDQDDEQFWRAKLACGHYQHVRHDPPLVVREWTLTEPGRKSRIGARLACRKCEEGSPKDFDLNAG